MSQYEIDILHRLSAQSAEPRAEFTSSLRNELLRREEELKTNVMPIRRQIVNYKILSIGLVSLAVLVGLTAYIFTNKSKTDEPSQTAQSQKTSTTQTSSLPSQQVQDLETAKKSLTFVPLLPSTQLNGETLSNIKVGTKNNMLDDSDTLYLTYSDNQGTLYKISQSSKKFNYPTDVEKVSLQIEGKKLTASYYKIPGAEVGESINSGGGGVSAPTSYMFWTLNSVNYEISEFGRLSKQELISVANSLN